jgi:hypothetical protein
MKKQTKTSSTAGARAIGRKIRAGAMLGFGVIPLAATGCPMDVEYIEKKVEVPVPTETSHSFVFKDVDNKDTVYLGFTDESWKIINNRSGLLTQFQESINKVIRHDLYREYFRNKERLDVFMTDFVYSEGDRVYYTIGSKAIIINVRRDMNHDNILNRLISEFESGIQELSDCDVSLEKNNDSSIRMAEYRRSWRKAEQINSQNVGRIIANGGTSGNAQVTDTFFG